MPTLTDTLVRSLEPRDSGYIVWDDRLTGFGVRVMPSGSRSFLVRYRAGGGGRRAPDRKMSLGSCGRMATSQAREIARRALADVVRGADPAAERQRHRRAPTFGEFAERYLAEHARPRKKARSAVEDKRQLERLVLPTFGQFKLADIRTSHVARLLAGMSDRPIAANRVRSLLHTIFGRAIAWNEMAGPNPVTPVDRYPERRRERFLSAEELHRLSHTLTAAEQDAAEPWQAIAAIRLLIFTGCRRSEILTLKWSYIDPSRGIARLPDSKTGAKTIHLFAPALAVLSAVPRRDRCDWVLPSDRRADQPFDGIGRVWKRTAAATGLRGVRLHDLRHTFASHGVALGFGLPLIGALLGHTQASTTQRYAHLADDPIRAAGARIASELSGAMTAPTVSTLKIAS
jgi:integrase